MKFTAFILIWILVTVGSVFATTTATSDEASEPSKTDFLSWWPDWMTKKRYKYADLRLLRLEYQYERRDSGNKRFTVRWIVHWGGGKDSPIRIRLRDVVG